MAAEHEFVIKVYRNFLKDIANCGKTVAEIEIIFTQIKQNPFGGNNIKPLKGYSHFYRYRDGNYSMIYSVEKRDKVIYIKVYAHRKDVYRDY